MLFLLRLLALALFIYSVSLVFTSNFFLSGGGVGIAAERYKAEQRSIQNAKHKQKDEHNFAGYGTVQPMMDGLLPDGIDIYCCGKQPTPYAMPWM